jgi:hypothetical protein
MAVLCTTVALVLSGCGKTDPKPQTTAVPQSQSVYLISYEVSALTKNEQGTTQESDWRGLGTVSWGPGSSASSSHNSGASEITLNVAAADANKVTFLASNGKGFKQEVTIQTGGSQDVWSEGSKGGFRIKVQKINEIKF